jgi:hypothetical protein
MPQVSAPLSMKLRAPTYLSGSARSIVQCTGRVARESQLLNGDIDYGVQIKNLLTFQRASVPRAVTSPPPSGTSPT